MIHLPELILSAAQMTREMFLSRYSQAAFIAHSVEGASGSDWSFRTQTVSSATLSIGKLLAEQGVALDKDTADGRVYPLVKTQDNPWQGRISIGRARNNDIVLVDTSVSKLHAHVNIEGGASTLTDAGSRNGTIVNGKRLKEGDKVDLVTNDKVVFGRVELVFFDKNGLYDLLMSRLQRSRLA